MFERTAVTLLYMCGELHNSPKSLSMNILSHLTLPASQAGGKNLDPGEVSRTYMPDSALHSNLVMEFCLVSPGPVRL